MHPPTQIQVSPLKSQAHRAGYYQKEPCRPFGHNATARATRSESNPLRLLLFELHLARQGHVAASRNRKAERDTYFLFLSKNRNTHGLHRLPNRRRSTHQSRFSPLRENRETAHDCSRLQSSDPSPSLRERTPDSPFVPILYSNRLT